MLVYANHFTLIGGRSAPSENSDDSFSESSTAAFRSVVRWLKNKTGRHFIIPELRISGEFQEGIYQVRTFAADKRDPKIYSVLLTHRDEEVFGRFWSTEISIRLEGENTFISVLLETKEMSARVEGEVITTRPALINYLADNAEFAAGTIGKKVRSLLSSEEDYKALLYEIEKKKRNYPLVLVSCREGKPLIDPEQLQRQLFGLAQIIYADETCKSWQMQKELGSNYSAWDGAVNIISHSDSHKGYYYTDLMRSPELEDLQDQGHNLLYEILARVTHSTNWAKRRQHFSPSDVRAKRQKDYLLFLREQIEQGKDNKETLEQLLIDADKELKEYKEESDKLLEEADKEREEAENKVNKLRYGTAPAAADVQQGLSEGGIAAILSFYGRQKSNSPEQCLEFAEQVLGDKIIILDTAKKSAQNAADYNNPHILLDALWKLGNNFLPAYLEGGDNKTKAIFGSAYRAKESEQTMNSPQCKNARTFSYQGKEVTMWQHLGWGKANNTRESLRLYFEVDKDDKKIIIGHCGAHLPTIKSNSV